MRGIAARRFAFALAVLLLCLLALPLAAGADGLRSVRLQEPRENPYACALAEILPTHEADAMRDGVFRHLEAGDATESDETQAHSAAITGVAEYWYPHYLRTVVIAVDREQTAAEIIGWGDLARISEAVGFYESGNNFSEGLLLCAMSYGLEGDEYRLDSAIELLAGLYGADRLIKNDFDLPVIICFDDQAARLIKEGRRLEIIVPAEGTLTYQTGLLSTEPLSFSGDADAALLRAGLRLLDGRADEAVYPDAAAYASASAVGDMEHLLEVKLDAGRTLRREVWRVRLYTGADAREHQFLALAYITVIFIWTASVVRRAMQRSVRRGALAVCAILLAWISVRIVKYQTATQIYWDRFLWFSFLGFQLLLMFTLLLMAWNIDIGPGGKTTPLWLRVLGLLNTLLALVVLTNDLHGWVYVIDYGNPLWRSDYGYAAGYYVITVLFTAEFIAANVLLLIKSIRSPGKKGLFFPLALCVLIFVYHWGYANRVPLMWESDMTMMTGVFALLFFESAVHSGMIPVNTKYATVFSRSTLKLQILDKSGATVLASASAAPLDERARTHVLGGAALPLSQDESTLLYGRAITGGYVAWQEDVSGLVRLHAQLEESVRQLRAANAILAEEEKIRRQLGEQTARRQLDEQLEGEIAAKTEELTRKIGALGEAEDQVLEAARIALLLCYIKRRCNLFFRERETAELPAAELAIYIEELSELAAHAGVKTAPIIRLAGGLPVRRATLLYDFFYEALAWAASRGCGTMLVQLGEERETVTLGLMPSADAGGFPVDPALSAAIKSAGGAVFIKDLDDATGISLKFSRGGCADA